jgi:hypothetical protein
MPSTKKLTVYRRSQFTGARRSKPPVRQLNRAIRKRVEDEHRLLQALVRDADVRRVLLAGTGGLAGPFTVWNDFDHSPDETELAPNHLPRWEDIGEFLKFHLLFQVALEDGGYSFTVRVRPDLEAKWKREQRNPMDRITREARKALDYQGLGELEYCYVVEARTKRGSRSNLHLHGFLLARDPLVATRFKVAMEQAIAVHPKGRRAAGIAPRSGPEVEVEQSYDVIDNSGYGRGRWAGYLAKNALRHDPRFRRRTFMSQPATQTARQFWALLREEPIT